MAIYKSVTDKNKQNIKASLQTFASVIPNVKSRYIRIAQDLPHGQRCYIALQARVAGTYIYIYNSEWAASMSTKIDGGNI